MRLRLRLEAAAALATRHGFPASAPGRCQPPSRHGRTARASRQRTQFLRRKGISDQDIADLAAWYAGHTVRVELAANADGAPAQCVSCHGADGLHVMEDAPNLAGETNIYIDTQLKAFRSGKRAHETMTPIAAELSDEEIRAVADWYASINIEIDLVE